MDFTFDEHLAIVALKTGLFFSRCDGNFDASERDVITNYINALKAENKISEECETVLHSFENDVVTIDEVISDTNKLIKEAGKGGKTICIEFLNSFIEKIIEADSVIDPSETKYHNIWKKAFDY
jgi:hypothetical protein